MIFGWSLINGRDYLSSVYVLIKLTGALVKEELINFKD